MRRLVVLHSLLLASSAQASGRVATFTVEIFDSGERVKSEVQVETEIDVSDYANLTIDGARSGTIEASFSTFREGAHYRVPLVLKDRATSARLAVGQSTEFSVGATTITLTLERVRERR